MGEDDNKVEITVENVEPTASLRHRPWWLFRRRRNADSPTSHGLMTIASNGLRANDTGTPSLHERSDSGTASSRNTNLSVSQQSKRFFREFLLGKWDAFDDAVEKRYQDVVLASNRPVMKAMAILILIHYVFLLLNFYTNTGPTRGTLTDRFTNIALYVAIIPVTITMPILSFRSKPFRPWIQHIIVCANGWIWAYVLLAKSVLCKAGAEPPEKCVGSQTLSSGLTLYATVGPLFMLAVYRLNRAICLAGAAVFLALLTWILSASVRMLWQSVMYLAGFYLWATLISYWSERVDRDNFCLRQELKSQIEATRQAKGGEIREAASKRRFVSYIFHEIRVPFNTAVLGFHNLEDEGAFHNLDSSQQSVLDAIKSSFSMMESVLNDVLDFQKMEEGRFELQSRPFDITSTVRSAAYAFASTAQEKNINLQISLDPRIATSGGGQLLGDDIRFRQVLNNFVSNALKFTPRDGCVQIATTLVDMNRDKHDLAKDIAHTPSSLPHSLTIRTSVKDSGVGISPEDLPKMFQPYIQINSWSTQGGKGTGLGLAICKHIIQLAGGTCGVDSSLDQGSTFWFEVTWPVAQGPTMVRSSSLTSNLRRPPEIDNEKPRPKPVLLANSLSTLGHTVDLGEPLAPAQLPAQEAQTQSLPTSSSPLVSSPPSRAATPQMVQGHGRSLRVLIVDDDKITRMLMSRLLNQMGHRYESAVDGQEAVDILFRANGTGTNGTARYLRFDGDAPPPPDVTNTSGAILSLHDRVEIIIENSASRTTSPSQPSTPEPFDVVLMDNQMPRLTGAEAVAVLRRNGILVPVVGITGNALKEDQDQFVAAGADLVITKPLAKGKLISALQLIP